GLGSPLRIAARNGFFVGRWRRGVVRWWVAVEAVIKKVWLWPRAVRSVRE
ncbi:MAG: hypothetical protein RLZZ162_610, partial [Verrucomicrobiota bacterium]